MARAGSPGISRSRKNVTRVMPNSTMTTCTRRRGKEPKRLTSPSPLASLSPVPPEVVPDGHGGARPAPGRLVLADGQRLQGQVVVAQRSRVEAMHPVPDAV